MTLPILGTMAAWQVTFLIVGLRGLLVAMLLCTVREPTRKGMALRADGQVATVCFSAALAQILARWPVVFGVSFGMACQAMANYALTFFGGDVFRTCTSWDYRLAVRTRRCN